MRISEALKNLAAALGAEDVTGETKSAVVNSLAEAIENGDVELGGSALPPVTAEDNGKVLKVVNGEWTATSE